MASQVPRIHRQSGNLASGLCWLLGIVTLAATAGSFSLRPQILSNFRDYPWGAAFPALALAGFAGKRWFWSERRAFPAGMLASAAFGVVPDAPPSSTSSAMGLTVDGAAATTYGHGAGGWVLGFRVSEACG